ncbi:MAG: cation:proton antiporter [Rhodobacteraceae bacterium]|nr:cation:proton antiporter [Paracoccaceae bacterium]
MASSAPSEPIHHIALTLADQLPILQVIVPFVAAPIIVFLGVRQMAWPLAFFSSVVCLIISFFLLQKVIDGTEISYQLGGWAPPLGIEYRVDATNAFLLFLISALSSIVLFWAREGLKAEIPEKSHTLFYALFLLCLTGLLGVVITGDAFNVFVFLEISSLSTYVLVAQGFHTDKRALTASYNYLIMGTIGATFFVIGIGFLYMATGTLNMADLAERIADQRDNRTVQAAFAFIVVGMGLKAAIYPLHLWLPNAYTFAPSPVAAFLSGTATKMAIYVLLRFMFTVFQPEFLEHIGLLEMVILPFAIIAMFASSISAFLQRDLKRMLAHSSVAQLGYMLLGIGLFSQTGLTATIIHLFNHGITKAALFLGVGSFVFAVGGASYEKLRGLGKTMPWTSAAMVISAMSLIGIPGTAGFISKWLLVQAAFEQGWWIFAFLIVLSSLIAVAYVWRMIEVLYFSETSVDQKSHEVGFVMLLPLWLLASSTIYFGFFTDITLGAADTAAKGLFSGSSGMF